MPINDFTIIKQLGSGAFSTVSLVTRKQDQKIYALKCVQISKLSPIERQNSLNEIRLLASINHKNIISYKESFYNEENQTLNIILEYADDGDLQTKIISKKKFGCFFEEKTIWSIFIQMVKGLNELHKKKIIHRDLKSANIFLMKNGVCKLGDLNVAKVVENGLLRTQTGTPYFASPEIWEDKPYSFKSDIWSIGCILYQMAGLKMPFQGKSIKEVYYNLKNINIQPLPDIYSPDLMNMIKKLLKLNPEERPSTKEILEDEIIKNRMKMIFENDNDLIDISLDINNFKKIKNKTKLINSIKVNNNQNLNYVLPQKNYVENEYEKILPQHENNINESTEDNIPFPKSNKREINQNLNNMRTRNKIQRKNISFNEENKTKKKKLKKNINSLNNIEPAYLPQINEFDSKTPKILKKIIKRECNSAKLRKDINNNQNPNNLGEKNNKYTRNANKNFNEKENTYQVQYKKIRPENYYKKNNKYYIYINNNQFIESISDNEIQKNFGTGEDSLINNDNIINKRKFRNRINKIKRVNSFLLTNRTKINSLKKNKITKNNSQYIFPMVNNKIYDNERNIKENKNNNLTLELNQNIKDIYNINSCKNGTLNIDNKEKNSEQKHGYNLATEKGKKLIPNHPLKYGKISFGFKENELYKNNQKCYYKSHNNFEQQENINSNYKNYNNNLLKKLFVMSPNNHNHTSDKNIIIQNNNININNNFNIKKKIPFVLNFNQKEKNTINLENINNAKTTKGKKEIFPIINNLNLNRGDLKLPKLSHAPVISLSNKEMNEDKNDKILTKNSDMANIEPAKRILINPIKIIEKKDNKIKLNPINSQIRINKLNDINNNAYK